MVSNLQVEFTPILSLQAMEDDVAYRYPQEADVMVKYPHQVYVQTTIVVLNFKTYIYTYSSNIN